MDREDRVPLIRSRLLALVTLLAGGAYILWLTLTVNWSHPWMATAFLAAEVVCLLLFLLATCTVWQLRYKPGEGLPIASPGSVDVLITVCGEPLDVIRATLDAAMLIDWPGRLVTYVLDDGGSTEVRRLAAERGFFYLSRPAAGLPRIHAKAGNLNYGLDNSAGEFVLVLDGDQVPERSILRVLAGYMRFPDVGFVQSRQLYYVPEGDPFFSLDRVFYGAVQLGYDHRDQALSCGSGVLYRRAALADNGGFSTWNVVEDLTTSLDLHSRGWRSFYVPHPLARGLAPAEIWSVYRQRGQWALDTMRLFFWDNPLWKRGLRWQTRLNYAMIPLSYLTAAFVFPFFFIVPLWTYVTGRSILVDSELSFVLFRGAYFLAMTLALRDLFRKHQAGRQFQMLVGLFPVYLIGTLRALVYPPSRAPGYSPNNAVRRRRRAPAVAAILPQLALLGANLVLPFYAIFLETAAPRLIAANAVISAVAIWSLLPTVFAALGPKVWDEAQNPYVAYSQPARTD